VHLDSREVHVKVMPGQVFRPGIVYERDHFGCTDYGGRSKKNGRLSTIRSLSGYAKDWHGTHFSPTSSTEAVHYAPARQRKRACGNYRTDVVEYPLQFPPNPAFRALPAPPGDLCSTAPLKPGTKLFRFPAGSDYLATPPIATDGF
jgi:hypothetical protein